MKPKADSWTEEKVNEDLFKNLSRKGVNFDFERNPDSDFPEKLQRERDRKAGEQGRQAAGRRAQRSKSEADIEKRKTAYQKDNTKTLVQQESS